jgi:hypothetical protein
MLACTVKQSLPLPVNSNGLRKRATDDCCTNVLNPSPALDLLAISSRFSVVVGMLRNAHTA